MQISFLNVIRDCKRLPGWWSILGAVFGNHRIDFLFQVGEKKCFTQRGTRLANPDTTSYTRSHWLIKHTLRLP